MPDNGGNGIRITNRELYDSLQSVKDTVSSMRFDLSNILSENVDLRKRVRSLELRFYAILSGLISGVGLLIVALARGALG